MIVFDTLFILLIIYLFIYCIYQLFFYTKARNVEKYYEMQEKTRNLVVDKRKLCVIIWASSKDKNLDNLLGILNNQTYPKENYQVHVVYQQDELDSLPRRDFALGAQIHNIQNPDYFSKDKAINLFLQKLCTEEDFDAYVFLGADRIVGEKYLENVNKTLSNSCVIIGSTICTNKKNQLAKKLKTNVINSYLKYTNVTKNIARSMFDLPFFVDGQNFIITKDVLDKIGYVALENRDLELEFSLQIALNDIKTIYSPYVLTFVDVKNYDFSTPTLKTRFDLLIRNFSHLITKSAMYRELVLFMLKPNSLVVLSFYVFLLILSICAPSHIPQKLVVALGVFLLINLVISIYISRISPKEIPYLLLYPFCLFWQKLKIFINTLTMRSIMNSRYEEENVNSATISAVVNNGKKDCVCKLDLVSEDGMRKVVFREGNRFIVTDSFLRMHDALCDMTYKLNSKGMTLKTCQNCTHFTLCPDGTLDCLNGKCQISKEEILIWNGCQFFNPITKEGQEEI